MQGNIKYIELLVDFSSNIYSLNKDNQTPLMLLVRRNKIVAMERILQLRQSIGKPVNLNYPHYNNGNSLLHVACLCKFKRMIKLLVNHGADIRSTNNHNKSPLMIAITNGSLDIVKYMVDKIKFNNKIKNKKIGFQPVACAIQSNHSDILKYLLQFINVNNKNNKGQTLLYSAVQCGSIACVDVLLNSNSNVNLKCCYGDSPLHVATRYKHHAIMEMLLNHKAEIDVVDEDNETPVYQASMIPCLKTIQTLIDHKCNLDICSIDHISPVYAAITNNQEDNALLLLSSGAQLNMINIFNNTNKSILQLAVKYNMHRLFEWCVKNHHMTLVNLQDYYDSTVLHDTCRLGAIWNVNLLIKYNAAVNMTNYQGDTPLLLATRCEHDHIVDVLLRNGADRHLANIYDESPCKETMELQNSRIMYQLDCINSVDYHSLMVALGHPALLLTQGRLQLKNLKSMATAKWYAHSDLRKLSKSMFLIVLSYLMYQ